MAIPILKYWKKYFIEDKNEGLGSSYERIVLNNMLDILMKKYDIQSCLEAPSFGFTGLSGINSMNLAKQGIPITLLDHDKERIELIREVWQQTCLSIDLHYTEDYMKLDFMNKKYDFAWSFSALWFVKDLSQFLKELTRITKKVIVFCVPNRTGMGYLSQKYISGAELKKYLFEEHIIAKNFTREMLALDWKLISDNYIDAPPWPDIGMKKNQFLRMFGIKTKEEKIEELSILNYYLDKEPDFPAKMMKHYWFEKSAPNLIKKFWAHHHYYLFEPSK